jgi:hypothetical protein
MTNLLAKVARYGLIAGDKLGTPEPGTWPALLDAIATNRITGHAVAACMDGALELGNAQFDELLQRHEVQLAIDLGTEQMLLRCSDRLAAAGIRSLLLKGPACAHRFYDDPSLRSFADGDLLVRSTDFDTALAIVEADGFRRRQAAPRSDFDRRFVKAVTLHDLAGFQLDLHRALTPGPYGVLYDVDAVFGAPSDVLRLGDHEVRCLSPALALAHACAHAALGDAEPKLVSLRDVAQLIDRGAGDAEAIGACERFRAGAVAQEAIARVERMFGWTPEGPFARWARAYRPSGADRRRLRSYAAGDDRYARQAAATFWVLPTMRDRVAYASALAFPERDYLERRHTSYVGRVARSTALVLRGRTR